VPGHERPSETEQRVTPKVSPSPTDPRALRLLTDGEIRPLGLLPRASNYTFLVELADGDVTGLGVYKPREGEAPLWDFPDGTLCNREVAAYVLSRALGWPRVPPTVLRDGPHGPGSVQLFVEPSGGEHYFTLRERCQDEFLAIAAFDVVANNADRKSGHCLLASDGAIWVVDHGVCFNEDPKLRTVIWDFAGDPVPPPLLADLEEMAGELRAGGLRTELLELLAPAEVDAAATRAVGLVRAGRFPKPGPERAYPWPPV
jgi:uncharacterized repeat protein (TIGR03843 family)